MNSRAKGARGERELANLLRQHGYECRRGQQYSGANGDADVVGLPGIHIECKRVEAFQLQKAMEQSIRDARQRNLPAVFSKKNYYPWLVHMRVRDFAVLLSSSSDFDGIITMNFEEWIEVYREWEAGRETEA